MLSGVHALTQKLALRYSGRSVLVVCGFSYDKDFTECLEILSKGCVLPASAQNGLEVREEQSTRATLKIRGVHLVQFAHPRAAPVSELASVLREKWENRRHGNTQLPDLHTHVPCYDLSTSRVEMTRSSSSVVQGLQVAVEEARTSGDIVLVCGSAFLMADARQALGLIDHQDNAEVADAWFG